MNNFDFIFPWRPIPWKRPGFRKAGGTYDTQTHLKKEVRTNVLLQMKASGWEKMHEVPLKVTFVFEFHWNLRVSKRRERQILDDYNNCLYHFKYTRPDLDNLAKFYIDACQGVLYTDDSQIVVLETAKIFSPHEITRMRITPLQKRDLLNYQCSLCKIFEGDNKDSSQDV